MRKQRMKSTHKKSAGKRKVIFIGTILIITIAAGAVIFYKNRPRILNDKTAKQTEAAFHRATKSDLVHEAVLYVESTDGTYSHSFSYGGRDIDQPMICASVTKLFTTTCILKLCEDGKLSLDDKVSDYFSDDVMDGLLVYNGIDYAKELTVSHLLFQNSGLPDRFEDGDMTDLIDGDSFTTFEVTVAVTKEDGADFIPGSKEKAHYSNINFDMLGIIITQVTGQPLADVFDKMIFLPLHMEHTYLLATDSNCELPTYYQDKKIYRPQILASSQAAGGCISTPVDLMTFSKAFWGGELFDKAVFDQLDVYRKLQSAKGPINYGGGYMQIPLNGALTTFLGDGELVGHCGSTGSFVFYYPELDLHIVGDLNEVTNPALPIRLLIQLGMI